MPPPRQLLLTFDPALSRADKPLRDGLSVAALHGDTLWVANDETLALERLTLHAAGAGEHVSFALADYLDLPRPPASAEEAEEADLEGLDQDAEGYLWLTGSHSLKRGQPKAEDNAQKAAKRLAKVSRDGNRYLLARIPLVRDGASWRPVARDGLRQAARLDGNDQGNRLTDALKKDEHLGPFLAIPGKDNGFDIEGLAVVDGRVFLGLRGPVLRGWAVILELEPEAGKARRLDLTLLEDDRPYLKHFLHLGGLGVRDLCRQGEDILILAGPTMGLDGPVRVLRWRQGARRHSQGQRLQAQELEVVREIPHGAGEDHAEGMTPFTPAGTRSAALLVVYDAASESRKRGEEGVLADVFPLRPQTGSTAGGRQKNSPAPTGNRAVQ